jgi:hypothetical protein
MSAGLTFASSESKAVGMSGGLFESIQRFAPRIVSVLKLGSYASVFSAGITGGGMFIAAAGAILLLSAGIMVYYGDKKKQQERLAQNKEEAPEHVPTDIIGRVLHEFSKIGTPSKYPLEAAFGLGAISSLLIAVQGAVDGFNPLLLGGGGLGLAATGVALFMREPTSAEAPQTDIRFASSRSQAVGAQTGPTFFQSPMKISATLLSVSAVLTLAQGVTTGNMFFVADGICSLLSNIIMFAFVRKNDFSLSGARQEAPSPKVSSIVHEKQTVVPQPQHSLA